MRRNVFEINTLAAERGALDWFVGVSFSRFEGREQHQSDYEVGVKWDDVEKIIEKFCAVAYPQAVAFRETVKRADAAKGFGWQPPSQSN